MADDELRRAFALMEQEQLAQSIDAFDAVLDAEPRNAEAWFGLGMVTAIAGQLDRARQAFEESLTLEPQSGTFNALGKVLRAQGELGRAERVFSEALFLDPDFVEPMVELGALYTKQERFRDARELLLRAQRIDSRAGGVALARFGLTWVDHLVEQGQSEAAIEVIRALRDEAEELPALTLVEAELLTRLDHRDEAIRVYRQALMAMPADDPFREQVQSRIAGLQLVQAGSSLWERLKGLLD
jgi:tetratricopeptide (TPR) repeat protein